MNKKITFRPITINFAYIPLFLIVIATLMNGLFNSFATEMSFNYPYTTFLFDPNDKFADFFKIILTFPGSALIHTAHWPTFINDSITTFLASKPQLTHFHLVPLRELIDILCRRLFTIFNPVFIYLCISLSWFLCLAIYAYKYLNNKKLFIIAMLALVFSYPFLFSFSRGNISSGITSACLIIAILMGLDKKQPITIALLIAIAINMRPNALLLAGTFFFFYDFNKAFLYCCLCIFLTALIVICSYIFAHTIYPDYNLITFLNALGIYHKLYVVGDYGFAYGSSMLGAIKLIKLIWNISTLSIVRLEKIITLASAAMLLLTYVLFKFKKITSLDGLFIITAFYVLSCSIFGDYNLLIFFGFVFFLVKKMYIDKELSIIEFIILLISICMLIPKNYFFYSDANNIITNFSYQIILNPLILTIGILLIFSGAMFSRITQK